MEIMEPSLSSIEGVDILLFDLDGTLVDMDKKFEFPLMLRAIKRFFKFIRPHKFPGAFWSAIKEIQRGTSEKTNHELLRQELMKKGFGTREELEEILDKVLNTDFPKAAKHFSPVAGALETMKLVNQLRKEKKIRCILATNPMFPLSAVELRLTAGGFDPADFEFITHSQNSYSCKPHVQYYQNLVDKLDLDPSKCLMIGNDPAKDLPASALGIRTFLLDCKKYHTNIKKYHKYPYILGDHQLLQKLLRELKC
ncbi:MAG: FMN phosphatase YigB (HAD superfamily) [Thermoproteota archaeon]|jgi:FMN phosphatase YigB (HAD superfamily)